MEFGFIIQSEDYFKANFVKFYDYYLNKQFVDATLACNGAEMKVHSLVIAAGSKYFEARFGILCGGKV